MSHSESQQAESQHVDKKTKTSPELQLLMSTCGKYTVKTRFSGDEAPGTAEATRTPILDGTFLLEMYNQDYQGMAFVGQGMFGFNGDIYQSTWVDSMSSQMYFSQEPEGHKRKKNEIVIESAAPTKDDRTGAWKKLRSTFVIEENGDKFTFLAEDKNLAADLVTVESIKESMFFEYTRVEKHVA